MSGGYQIDAASCIRCAACATVAPDHFSVGVGTARVTRSPETAAERAACESAVDLCPTRSIRSEAPVPFDPGSGPPSPAPLFRSLLETSEAVRWKATQLPRDRLDPGLVTPSVKAMVREMAFSEQTTFSATQRFMQHFGDRPDFSEWISVWFYEETRHPRVLLDWLALAGETPGDDFVAEGRVSTPFMKSRTGTLVTNVISELYAAHAYASLPRLAQEPLLLAIGKRISADEARHAASFFVYARQAIALAADPDRERLDALKVLHFWLDQNASVSHPVNEMLKKVGADQALVGTLEQLPESRARVVRVVSRLLALPLEGPAAVEPMMVELTRRVHAAGRP